jgi:hypothetical protein
MPAPIALAALAAAPALMSAAGTGISKLSYANRKNRQLLKQDVKDMEAGKLGLSAAEKRERLAMASKAIRAQSDAARAAQARMLASGAISEGAATSMSGRQAAGDAAALGAAGGDIQRQSDAQAQSRRASILQRLGQQAAQNTATGAAIGAAAGDALATGTAEYTAAKKVEGAERFQNYADNRDAYMAYLERLNG